MNLDNPYLGRIVVILSPIFLGIGAWLATWIADNLPGNPEISGEDVQFVILGAFLALAGIVYKWLDNRGKHEQGVELLTPSTEDAHGMPPGMVPPDQRD